MSDGGYCRQLVARRDKARCWWRRGCGQLRGWGASGHAAQLSCFIAAWVPVCLRALAGSPLTQTTPSTIFPDSSTHEFKYSSFHDKDAAAKAAADTAATAAEAAAATHREAAEAAAGAAAAPAAGQGEGHAGPSVAQRLMQQVDKVAEAAAAEALGATAVKEEQLVQLRGSAGQRARLRMREQRPVGVLYLDEKSTMVSWRGGLGSRGNIRAVWFE